jgi:hypothetical protein
MMGMSSTDSWVRQAFFGAAPDTSSRSRGYDLEQSFSTPDVKTLPEVLAATNAGGWLAEGLTRLYLVEEIARRYAGRFQHLEISPATAQGVRVKGTFSVGSGRDEEINIEGLVPLRRAA